MNEWKTLNKSICYFDLIILKKNFKEKIQNFVQFNYNLQLANTSEY